MGNSLDSISLAVCDARVNADFRTRMQANRSSEMTVSGSRLLFDNMNQMLLIQPVKSYKKVPEIVIIPYDSLTRILCGDPRELSRYCF